ncbi:MAG: MBL fold metallo-hydrolase [Anaerolineae bacterium]|nr:MBL fold metallo-hydrolase [Anaerolineae bacterium]
MILETLIVGQIETCCYVVGDRAGGTGMIVDPGGNAGRILQVVDKHDVQIRYVVNTHGHFDHILANEDVLDTLRANQTTPPQLVAHPNAVPLLAQAGGAAWFGIAARPGPAPDLLAQEGDELAVGSLRWQILHTPGHSPGSICLYCAAENTLFSGDVLFRRGIGRTDLPGGDFDTLIGSIEDKLFALPDTTRVYPGHGQPTTIGEEKRGNLFV